MSTKSILNDPKWQNNTWILKIIFSDCAIKMLGLDRDSSIWVCVYFPVSWMTQFGHGLVTTVVGPTQPYLAKYAFISMCY